SESPALSGGSICSALPIRLPIRLRRRFLHPGANLTRLCQRLNVHQHPAMNAVNDEIGPQIPITRRPHSIRVPGCAFQARPPVRQVFDQELSMMADDVAVKVRWMA